MEYSGISLAQLERLLERNKIVFLEKHDKDGKLIDISVARSKDVLRILLK